MRTERQEQSSAFHAKQAAFFCYLEERIPSGTHLPGRPAGPGTPERVQGRGDADKGQFNTFNDLSSLLRRAAGSSPDFQVVVGEKAALSFQD